MHPFSGATTFVSLSTDVYGAELSMLALAEGTNAVIAAPEGALLVRASAAGLRTSAIVSPEVLGLRQIGEDRRPWTVAQRVALATVALSRAEIWDSRVVVSFSQWLNPCLALAGLRKSAPVVLDMHDGPFTRLGQLIQFVSAKIADEAVFVSRSNAASVVGSRAADVARVIARPIEVPAKLKAQSRSRDLPLRVCYVGRLDAEKRVQLLLDAAASLPVEMVHVTVIGEASQSGVSSLELASIYRNVSFLGRCAPLAALEEMAQCDVLVSPAVGEAFGRTVFEAGLLSVPSVVDASAASAALLLDASAGWVLGGERPWGELPQLLLYLSRHPEEVSRVGENARTTLGPLVDRGRIRAEYWDVLASTRGV